jgi:hypothetical protein
MTPNPGQKRVLVNVTEDASTEGCRRGPARALKRAPSAPGRLTALRQTEGLLGTPQRASEA